MANNQPLLWALNKAIIIDLDILNDTVNIKSLTKHEPIPLAIVVLQLLSDKIVKHTSEAWLTEEFSECDATLVWLFHDHPSL